MITAKKIFALRLITSLIQPINLSSLSLSLPISNNRVTCKNRRQVLQGLAYTISTPTLWTNIIPKNANAATIQSISDRLTAESLVKVEPSSSRNKELKQNGIDNLYYPSWLEGTWDATQTLKQTLTPLGLKYVGGPNGSLSIAKETMTEQEKELDKVYSFQVRFLNTKFGVAEDRLFNTKQRLNTFAGRKVVASVEYNDVSVCNRAAVLAMGGGEDDPLQTTVVRFKGPAAQKTFLLDHNNEISNNKFYAYESLRSIFALTNTNTSPPVTTDTELIWYYELVNDNIINAKLRIASYLNSASDALYFDARNRAVSFNDYDITLKKVV